mgnify:CR=1 FL=1
MKKMYYAAALLLPLTLQVQAQNVISENRSLDAKVEKLQIDGVVDVQLKQGAVASLLVFGDKDALGKLSTEQTGQLLHIKTAKNFNNKNKLRAEITLPHLSSLVLNGVGRSEAQGFTGELLQLELKGAGTMQIQGSYKHVISTLSGVGSLNLNLSNNDNTEFKLSGTGSALLRGKSKDFHADLSGLGSLDAQHFEADSLTLRLKGMGSASAFAKKEVTLNLSGMGSATIYGNPPTRSTKKSGMGSVTWK